MPRRMLLVRHGHGPEDDRVAAFVARHGFLADTRRPFAGQALGDFGEDIAGVVIYGGPFNAYDTLLHPFLSDEYRLIEWAMAADVPLLGICQGAQMIAHHCGAHVGPHPDGWHEFGYYEVTPTEAGVDFLPRPLHMAEAHYHGFEVPADGEALARSALYPNQAFRIGQRIYGLQFHAEQTMAGFRRWQDETIRHDRPGVQSRAEQTRLMHLHDEPQAAWFGQFLTRLFAA